MWRKLSNKFKSCLGMILLLVLVMIPADFIFLLRRYTSFCASFLFRFHTGSKSVSIEWRWWTKTAKICWTLLYTAVRIQRILIKTCFFWQMHVSRQQCGQHTKSKYLGCWASNKHKPVVMNISGVMSGYAISRKRVMGLYVFKNDNVTCETYQNMLMFFAFSRFKFPWEDNIFQQDDAILHYSNRVTLYLNNKRLNNGISSGGPRGSPARSLDLTLAISFRGVLSN